MYCILKRAQLGMLFESIKEMLVSKHCSDAPMFEAKRVHLRYTKAVLEAQY